MGGIKIIAVLDSRFRESQIHFGINSKLSGLKTKMKQKVCQLLRTCMFFMKFVMNIISYYKR